MYSGFIVMFMILGLLPLLLIGLLVWGVWTIVSHKRQDGGEKEIPSKGVDILLYIGQFITIMTTLSSLVTIFFIAIDHKFKDVLKTASSGYSYNTQSELATGEEVRLAISILLVAFPLFIAFSHFVTRRIKLILERKELVIRSIYLYGLILLSTLTMASSFIAIVYQFLSGELFVRFGPKALFLMFLSVFVCGYYVYSLRRDYATSTKIPLTAVLASTFLILSVISFGVIETGSPRKIRAMRFDQERLVRLSNLQQEIVSAWQRGGVLPVSLSDVKNDFNQTSYFTDPETGKEFEYHLIKQSELTEESYCSPYYYNGVASGTQPVNCQKRKTAKTDAQFEICATFGAELTKESITNNVGMVTTPGIYPYEGYAAKDSISSYYAGSQVTPAWEHKEGRHCFTRTIKTSQYQIYDTGYNGILYK